MVNVTKGQMGLFYCILFHEDFFYRTSRSDCAIEVSDHTSLRFSFRSVSALLTQLALRFILFSSTKKHTPHNPEVADRHKAADHHKFLPRGQLSAP